MTQPRRHALSVLAIFAFVGLLVGTSKSPPPPPPPVSITVGSDAGHADAAGGNGSEAPNSTGGAGGIPETERGPSDAAPNGSPPPDGGLSAVPASPLPTGLSDALSAVNGEVDAVRLVHPDAVSPTGVEARYIAAFVSNGFQISDRSAEPSKRSVTVTRGGERYRLQFESRKTGGVYATIRGGASAAESETSP